MLQAVVRGGRRVTLRVRKALMLRKATTYVAWSEKLGAVVPTSIEEGGAEAGDIRVAVVEGGVEVANDRIQRRGGLSYRGRSQRGLG
jgi:hypothetical protein